MVVVVFVDDQVAGNIYRRAAVCCGGLLWSGACRLFYLGFNKLDFQFLAFFRGFNIERSAEACD